MGGLRVTLASRCAYPSFSCWQLILTTGTANDDDDDDYTQPASSRLVSFGPSIFVKPDATPLF